MYSKFTARRFQVNSAVSNAIRQQLVTAAAERREDIARRNMMPFLKVPVPRDGLCCYHSTLYASNFATYSKIARHSNGYAINRRRVKEEESSARELRQLALDSTESFNDSSLSKLAKSASGHLYVDIQELKWLGYVLDLAVRCTMQSEASQGFSLKFLEDWAPLFF